MKNPKRTPLFILLVVTAVAGNYIAIPLFFGFDFLFGGIAVLLILYFYGTAAGVAVAALAASYTYMTWGHPYGIVIFTTEALFAGLLLRRLRGNFLLVEAVFWAMVGLPMVWLIYSWALQWDNAATQLVILKQSLNGIYNALVASYLVYFTSLRQWVLLDENERTQPFGQILASVLASFLLLPALAFLVIYGRLELTDIQRDIKRFLLENTSVVSQNLVTWRDTYSRAMEQTARAGTKSGMARSAALQHDVEVIQRAFPDFHGVYVADAGGTTVAFSPPVNEKGESTIGINFSDREYFTELITTRRPVLSAVFTGRGGVFAPIAALGFPVIQEGRFSGFAVGAINLSGVSTLLKRATAGQNIQLTLVDQTGRVVASTGAAWKPLQPFVGRERRDLQSLGDSVYQSFPQRKDLPDIIRWKQSYFTVERRVAGDLPWTLAATIPAQSYVDALQRSYIQVLTFTLGFIIMGLVLSQVLSRLLTRPLSGLASLTSQLPERIRAGLQNGWPRSQVKEISFLVDNFMTMERVLRENFDALTLSKDALAQQASELNYLNENLRQEIAERKQVEDSLRKSEQQVRLQATALVSAANAIVITDRNGVIEWVNPAFTQLTDYTFDEAVGENLRLLKSDKHDGIFYQNLWTTILSGRVWHDEIINRRKDGSLYAEEQTIAPVIAGDGRITHFVSIMQDISERKLAEAKLRQNMEELEKANRVKNEFLGVMSHELRTPLNVIMGYNQMIQEGAFGVVNPEQNHALGKIKLQSAELLRMVNSILAVTKIEADDLAVELDAIDIEAFVNGLKDQYNTPLTHGVTIGWDCQPNLPQLISDANKLKHIMENLVNNALKFTDEGYIHVTIERLPEEGKIALVVTDTGIGIAAKDLPVIFEKFRQGDSSANRSYGGAGLGLYIVKKYTELLGGEVRVDSAPGKGSTFTVELPMHYAEQAADLVEAGAVGQSRLTRFAEYRSDRIRPPRIAAPSS